MKRTAKIIRNVILSVIAVILVVVAAYLIYVFASYKRIEDNLVLEVHTEGSVEPFARTGCEYSIETYNIGFGAYLPNYSFFMDGGESSWAESEEVLIGNINDIGAFLAQKDADFICLQEVDIGGTRTYNVNEAAIIRSYLPNRSNVFAVNYDSPFLFWPINEPHGANRSGLLTLSTVGIESSLRRSLPVSQSVKRVVDLDRCYSISRIPVDNGKELCIYNVHLSAYGTDATVRQAQRDMLFADLASDVAAGNYIICSGDYNHNMRQGAVGGNIPDWAGPFPFDELPSGMRAGYDGASFSDIEHDTCRNSNEPYVEGHTFTVMADCFLVSDNITVNSYSTIDTGFLYSDHDPVFMIFELQE